MEPNTISTLGILQAAVNLTESTHIFKMRQDPTKGKAIGFSQIHGNFITSVIIAVMDVEHDRNYAGVIAQASLWNDDMTRCEGFMKILKSKADHSEKPIFATLTGKTVVPGFEMIDPEDGVKKLFFGFHDLFISSDFRNLPDQDYYSRYFRQESLPFLLYGFVPDIHVSNVSWSRNPYATNENLVNIKKRFITGLVI
jgi:hypothetical protein